MRLKCEANVVNRQAASNGIMSSKFSVANVFILQDKTNKKAMMKVCTVKNKDGKRYSLNNNLLRCFEGVVKEGKATIRLIAPQVDIFIRKANPVELKLLVTSVKAANASKDVSKWGATSTNAVVKTKDLTKPKTKMVIRSPLEYRKSFPLPYSLEKLDINGCALPAIAQRILKLKHLTHLSLEGNNIKQLPDELKNFNLMELNLNSNKVEKVSERLFSNSTPISKSLRHLELCDNLLKKLPLSLSYVKNLTVLRIKNNNLTELNLYFNNLCGLRILDASSNNLKTLPFSILRLRLNELWLEQNNFETQLDIPQYFELSQPAKVLSLQELAANSVRGNYFRASKQFIPYIMKRYLEAGSKCSLYSCNRYSFFSKFISQSLGNLSSITASLHLEPEMQVVRTTSKFCSFKCKFIFENTPSLNF